MNRQRCQAPVGQYPHQCSGAHRGLHLPLGSQPDAETATDRVGLRPHITAFEPAAIISRFMQMP